MSALSHVHSFPWTCFSGVFITKGDVGVGTIVGSAVFNILCIIGVCGLFAGQVRAFNDPLQLLLHPVPWLYCRITCRVHSLASNFSGFVVFNRALCCSSRIFEMKNRAAKVSSGVLSCPRCVGGQRNKPWLFAPGVDCSAACQSAHDNTSYSSEIKAIKLWDLSCCLHCRRDWLYN